jgi:hypothetical protein
MAVDVLRRPAIIYYSETPLLHERGSMLSELSVSLQSPSNDMVHFEQNPTLRIPLLGPRVYDAYQQAFDATFIKALHLWLSRRRTLSTQPLEEERIGNRQLNGDTQNRHGTAFATLIKSAYRSIRSF